MPAALNPHTEALILTAQAPHFNPALNARELRLAQEYAGAHGGLLPQDRFWSNLEARFALDPARFAHYHPRITGLLERDQVVRFQLAVQGMFGQAGNPNPGVTTPSTSTPGVSPLDSAPLAAVPEPGPLGLVGATLAVAFAFGRRKRKATSR